MSRDPVASESTATLPNQTNPPVAASSGDTPRPPVAESAARVTVPGGTAEDSLAGEPPLFVDLDGTLVATDLLYEAVIPVLRQDWRNLCRLPQWLSRGKAALKAELSARVVPDAATLPWNEEVLAWLKDQHARGRTLVLATASPVAWAEAVAEHLGMFDDVLATRPGENLRGLRKLEFIRAWCREHDCDQFAYVGDSSADLPVWQAASEIHVVSSTESLYRKAARADAVMMHHPVAGLRPRAILKCLRPHQWAKNVLLLAPMLLGQVLTAATVIQALLAFGVFSLTASAVYVLNDLVDVSADRRHPRKCRRPFAAGTLPLTAGPPLIAALLGTAVLVTWLALPPAFAAWMGIYLVTTTAYSLWLKRKLIVDVFVLAGLYTLRIIAGGAATGVPVSEWLMAFSMFLFTSLAFVKRYAELSRLDDEGAEGTRDRSYLVTDLGIIESIGPASGYLAVLVLALYINSDAMRQNYRNPWALWMICPLVLYWITRVWFVARRRKLSEDPVVFALKDPVSRLVGVCAALLIIAAATSTVPAGLARLNPVVPREASGPFVNHTTDVDAPPELVGRQR
ncbi:MAG: UbiA family prenyltransferase [Planctomycetaceae bacterium]|nr:UbiA family prenyltransferase [Planctomycetaceae bacterium]